MLKTLLLVIRAVIVELVDQLLRGKSVQWGDHHSERSYEKAAWDTPGSGVGCDLCGH